MGSFRCLIAALAVGMVSPALAEETQQLAKPTPNSPDEPLAKQFSLTKSAEFLDGVAASWTRERRCGTCHTNYAYMIARPALKEKPSAAWTEVQQFFVHRASNWDSGKKDDKPRWPAEVVATAVTLAFYDAQTTGRLQPATRKALDKMWTLQRKDGGWDWLKCGWPPYEHDDYYGAVFAAVGVGITPDNYAESEKAKEGVTKLRKYLKESRPPDLHHKTFLLWASLQLDGLMTQSERDSTIKELLSLQHEDGGGSLPPLGDWKRKNGQPNDKNAPSDGYGTGLVVYVLRQTGMKPSSEPIRRGVDWLKAHQRESGRWFTRSLNNDRAHYITHAGTGFAVMALKACNVE